LGVGAHLEADLERLALERLATGSTISAISAVGFMKRSAWTWKSRAEARRVLADCRREP
jgi:hypothetical protein